MPVRPAPIASATAFVTSMTNRARFYGQPPYWSSRTLAAGERNSCRR